MAKIQPFMRLKCSGSKLGDIRRRIGEKGTIPGKISQQTILTRISIKNRKARKSRARIQKKVREKITHLWVRISL